MKRREPARVLKIHDPLAGRVFWSVKGESKGAISCAVGAGVESTRAGRSKESPKDPGPGADCGFAAPQRKVSSGSNAVERIIIHIGSAVHGRPQVFLGGTTGPRLSSRNKPRRSGVQPL
jgi:hypothetical protein